ncbi:uncharacterized protein FPRN_15243 [Fusarium proliferatum]|nr:uncharacterized protein FPRN_15243 [Fusarium proliferatum]
MLYIFPFTYNL